MKKLLYILTFLITTMSMAQTTELDILWKKIDESYEQGELKSLQPQISKAIEDARKKKNYPLLVKGLFYDAKIKIVTSDAEDDVNFIFKDFEAEIQKSKGTEQLILKAYLGKLYQIYYQENQWKINSRTQTESPNSDDVRYWTQNHFFDKIDAIYTEIIQNKKNLQAETSSNWIDFLEFDKKNGDKENLQQNLEIMPTVYDFLMEDYISFLTQQSEKEKEITIYQDLSNYHQQHQNIAAFLYNQEKLIDQKNDEDFSFYIESLENLTQKYPKNWYTAEIYTHLASRVYNRYVNDKQLKEEDYQRVFGYNENVKKNFPNTNQQKTIQSIADEIKSTKFNVEVERYILPNENTPIKISHKNLSQLYVKILDYNVGVEDLDSRAISEALNQNYKDSKSRFETFLKNHKTIQSYKIDIKSFSDHQNHEAIYALQSLPAGRYVLLLSEDLTFQFNPEKQIKYIELNVTDKVIVVNNAKNIRVLNRSTGEILTNQKVEFYRDHYNSTKKKNVFDLIETKTSNAKGELSFDKGNRYYYRIAGENVFYSNSFYDNNRQQTDSEQKTVKIFTDRAIYRPSQTVYFKGILTSTLSKNVKVLPREKVTVRLMDVNGKEVQQMEFETNEFGSFHGEFILPSSVLTGNFSIQTNYNSYYRFKVEEYKRPKFEVEMDKTTQVYRIDDSVKVEGKAIAFSGANIDNAKVEYRVYRQAIYPFRYWGRYIPHNVEPEEEITFGTTETDKDGKFSFDFKAIPARKQKDKEDIRTYVYRIETSVTDINGETQSASSTVKVGDRLVMLSANLNEKSSVKDLDKVVLNVTNLNDQPISKAGEFTLTKLIEPNRAIRKSPYITNYEAYSKAEFIKLFPHEAYGDEQNPMNWEKGNMVFQTQFNTANSKEIHIPNAEKLDEGYYVIEMKTKDQDETIENAQIVYLQNEKLSSPKQLLTYDVNQTKFEPKDQAKIKFATNADELKVLVRLEANGKIVKEELLTVTPKSKTFEFPIEDSYKGGVFVHYQFVKFNSIEKGKIILNVPFDNKKLSVTTSTLRDKLMPGVKEKWTFTVKGEKKDAVLAEVLSTMYDASLDQFASNSLDYFAYGFRNYSRLDFSRSTNFSTTHSTNIFSNRIYPSFINQYYLLPLNTYNFTFENHQILYEMAYLKKSNVAGIAVADSEGRVVAREGGGPVSFDANVESEAVESPESQDEKDKLAINFDNIEARKALQETAFFYPNLRTDKDGNVAFEFTVPESLTEWKLMTFAHTPDMKTGYNEISVRTQKDLMVVPNLPRFLREGDEVKISTKIVNLSDQSLSGAAKLMLFDAISNKALDAEFQNLQAVKNFTTAKGESGEVNWTIKVPKDVQAITYRIVASAGDFSDGEESVLPVVTNRMLVTETMPIYIRENQQKTFTLDKLMQSNSNTLDHFNYTFEMTTNPIWYAIFSLPYLREYPYECAEQVFSRLYGNLISENIISSNPKIKAVFDDWNRKGELKSKLELNQELKNIILEETPWVRDAVSEEEQMKRIALLFDLNKMQLEMKSAFDKLSQKQKPSGGFSWFDGGRENDYITTHIVAGFGNMKKMNIDFDKYGIGANDLIEKAINYIDNQQIEYYKEQQKLKKNELDWSNGIHYLYARSFFLDQYPMPKQLDALKKIYIENIKKSAKDFPLQTQGMAALVLNRFNEKTAAQQIVKHIKERSVDSDEMGMYWKANQVGWFWYNTPIETQAVLIEAFDEVLKDEKSVESMKVWLLKNRQTNQWNSTKATTKAVYALMNTGKSWIDAEKGIAVKVGNETIDLDTPQAQSGSGYVKMTWNKAEIKPEMAKVEVEKTSPGVAWGAVYWQYFEDLDKITSAETGIKFNKKLYLKQNTANGPTLKEITTQTPINVGDLVTVRLEISIDRNMEFVHIKDMRASGFEPVNVLSGYKWKGEFGYYESTRDLATNFFADFMRKGTYVFEYDLRANNAGSFSNGITSMQNMYAPELSAHSEGIRVEIK